jgi:hypothetical protein
MLEQTDPTIPRSLLLLLCVVGSLLVWPLLYSQIALIFGRQLCAVTRASSLAGKLQRRVVNGGQIKFQT